MRAIRVIAGMAGLLFTVAACGQAANQSASSGGSSSQPAPTSASSAPESPSSSQQPGELPPVLPPKVPPSVPLGLPAPTPPEGATLLPASQVDTSGLPSYYKDRNVYSLNGGRTLLVSAMGQNACTGVQGLVTEQSGTAVRITISPMDVPQGGSPDQPGMCAQVITPRLVSVDLKAPLGDRRVYVSGGV